ncbi:heterogeneous nuclear ribonucleoprotein A0-like [Clytia hemisphaerica]|uniref:RRM domain-containing protein n=1 Tax=Clytia hemisphaerica TaxID=252671 RepID=A0A7M5WL75_9CNID
MADTEEQVPQTEEPTTEKVESTEEEKPETEEEEITEFIRDPILDEEEMKKVFVGGISTESTEDELKQYFEEKCGGSVTDTVIIKKDTDKKSHFGFLTFETSDLVDEVLLKREELNFKGRQLDVNRAVPKNNNNAGAHERTKKLFIANLPKMNCSEDDLLNYFKHRHPKKYGTIESIQLIKKKDEKGNKMEENKGYGFVMVTSEDLADKMAIQHATFEFGGRKIELKKSVPTNEGGGHRGRRGRGGNNQMQGGMGPYGGGGYDPYWGYGGNYGGYGGGYGGYGEAYGWGGYGGGAGGNRGGRGGRGRFTPY